MTSLSKIGFGDYVPRPNPPEQWARQEFGDNKENPNFETIEHKFDLTKCVEDIVGTSTKYFKVAGNPIDVSSKVYCRPTEWDNIYWLGYWLYRFLVFIWQLTGLSFSGTVVSMLVKKMQQVIPELFPCMVVDSEKPVHTFPSPYNRSLCPSRNALIDEEASRQCSPVINQGNRHLLQLIPQNCALTRQSSNRTQKSDSGVASGSGTPYNRRRSLNTIRSNQPSIRGDVDETTA